MIIPAIVAYLFGSFPTAYLVVRWKTGRNIWELGSGNVGSLNTYRVTGSKALAALVAAVDVSKALLAYFVVSTVWPESVAVVPFFTVLGHNFPIWTRFRGGRGLAVFLALATVMQPQYAVAWLAVWVVGYLASGYLAVGTVVASVLAPIVCSVAGCSPVPGLILAEVPLLVRYRDKMDLLANGRLPRHYWRDSA